MAASVLSFPIGLKGRPGEHDPVPGTEAMMRQRSKWFPIEEALDLRQRPVKGQQIRCMYGPT